MSINFGSMPVRTYASWSDFLAMLLVKGFRLQCETSDDRYQIWAYDGPEAHLCVIWRGSVPSESYDQTQNDLDLADFEANYLATTNLALQKVSAAGVQGSSPAKGLGGFAPDPTNNPYQPEPDEVASHYVDSMGQLMVRGPVITDEGSIRDDFTGSALETTLTGSLTFTTGSREVTGSGTIFTEELNRDHYVKLVSDTGYENWSRVVRAPNDTNLLLDEEYPGSSSTGAAHKTRWVTAQSGISPGTTSVGSSNLTISSGTSSTSKVRLYRNGDYLPCISIWRASLSQRVANQTSHIGFRDTHTDPMMYAEVRFSGTDNTLVSFVTGWNQDEQVSTVSLPAGLDTSQVLRYKIDTAPAYCALLVNGVPIAKHENHIPDMYAAFLICAGIENSAAVTNTDLVIDSVYFNNTDNIQVSSTFLEPMPVVTSEDQHSLVATLTTTTTTANQIVLSYTVPAGRVLFIIGYLIDAEGAANGVFKLGRNNLTTEPSSPGALDGNILRCRYITANGSFSGEFGSNPRRLGVGGDVILMTITPDSLLPTKWRCALDFVLR
jgi:hypothetical protein